MQIKHDIQSVGERILLHCWGTNSFLCMYLCMFLHVGKNFNNRNIQGDSVIRVQTPTIVSFFNHREKV